MSMNELIDKFQDKERYDDHVECLEKHLSRYFKDDEMTVFHELLSLDFHLDVYFIQPKDRSYNLLLTSGMSIFEMTVDEGVDNRDEYLFAELMVLVPKDLKFDDVHTGKERNSWIISMLKATARFPHHYDTYMSIGHTLQATADLEPYSEETNFVGCVILPSVTFDNDFTEINCNGKKINIYSLFPLYKNELEHKVKHGYNGFVDLLRKGNPKECIDTNRKNLIKRKGIGGIFKKD
jgi:hypothetical protein